MRKLVAFVIRNGTLEMSNVRAVSLPHIEWHKMEANTEKN